MNITIVRSAYFAVLLGLLSFATSAFAQTTPPPGSTGGTSGSSALDGSNLKNLLLSIIGFINDVLVPLIFALAFIVFLWGIFTYFVAGGADEEKRDKGKKFAIWGILAFFIMVSIWGIVNLLVNSIGFSSDTTPKMPNFQVN